MAQNYVSSFINWVTQAARNAEYPGTPLSDITGDGTYANPYLGCNLAGSNANGIGINTAKIDPKLQDWSLLDQHGEERAPEESMHIGNNGLGAGLPADPGSDFPIRGGLAAGAFFDELMYYLVADQQAVTGAIFNTSESAVNRSSDTVEIGDRIWGTVTFT